MESEKNNNSFPLKVTLVIACASFLFGINVSMLNTALKTISQDFQMCGQPKIAHAYFYKAEVDVTTCKQSSECTDCIKTKNNKEVVLCPGGHGDIECDDINIKQALIVSMVLVGGAIGSLTGGHMMRIGRRKTLLINCLIFSIGIISSVCSNSISSLAWARTIVGYGVGVISVVCPTYIAEMTPSQKRGFYGVFHQSAITIGILVGVSIGLPLNDSEDHYGDLSFQLPTFYRIWWRFMLGLGLVPVCIVAYLLLFCYKRETPVWYIENNQLDKAKELLVEIYGKDDVEKEFNETVEYVKFAQAANKTELTTFRGLKDSKYRQVIIVGMLLAAFQQLGGINVFVTSSNTFYRRAGMSVKWQTILSIIMTAINVVMTFPTIFLIEVLGRKTLLLFGSAMQTAFLIPPAVSYFFDSDVSNPSSRTVWLSVVAIYGFVVFFASAMGPVVWVYLFEIYPIEIKNAASSSATAVNWGASIVIVILGLILNNKFAFALFSVLQFFSTLFILFFIKETKGRMIGNSPYIKEASSIT